MNKTTYIIFTALIALLTILNITYGAPRAINVWEFIDYLRGHND